MYIVLLFHKIIVIPVLLLSALLSYEEVSVTHN